MKNDEEFAWLKNKGYLHLTPQINIYTRRKEIISKVTDPKFISNYAFFPLIHSCIKERKYKRIPESQLRAHSYWDKKEKKFVQTAKPRPLHYAAHMDSLIYGYYATLLLKRYEEVIKEKPHLSDAVIAYRKIKLPKEADDKEPKGKSTIHFAKEVFENVKNFPGGECVVLKYDIKSFFNRIDHKLLLEAWMNLFSVPKLLDDHYNVYKACTRFSYVLKNDFRQLQYKGSGKRSGFDEKRIAKNRNKFGVNSFFASIKEFRSEVKNGKLRIYKFPFRNKGLPCGIPQGLPISSVLANIYLMKFDIDIIQDIVVEKEGFYRRYSDDIIVICKPSDSENVNKFITEKIKESNVEMSLGKIETFLFKDIILPNSDKRFTSIKIEKDLQKPGIPLTYLGFEFYGYKTLIKSANLSKFYRRMILTVKRKAKRALSEREKKPEIEPAIYFNQLNRLYKNRNLNLTKIRTRSKYIVRNEKGEYSLRTKKINRRFDSNYLKYIARVSDIMEESLIARQVRKHTRILKQAIKKYFWDKKNAI